MARKDRNIYYKNAFYNIIFDVVKRLLKIRTIIMDK